MDPNSDTLPAVRTAAEEALNDPGAMARLLQGLAPERTNIRTRDHSMRVLDLLSQEHPEALLPHWDYFVSLLSSRNALSKLPAVHIIANLTRVDSEGRFEAVFDAFYRLLEDQSIAVACHVAAISGQIIAAKPHLEIDITLRLLAINSTHFPPDHKELLKRWALNSFQEYGSRAEDREGIIGFVRDLASSQRPATRKKAREVMRQLGAGG